MVIFFFALINNAMLIFFFLLSAEAIRFFFLQRTKPSRHLLYGTDLEHSSPPEGKEGVGHVQ